MKLTEHFMNFISGKTASGPEQNISESEARRFLYWTMAAWAVIWFIAPVVMIGGIYFDIAENIEWGKHWQFGYDKHPFLTAWVTRAAYDITGGAWSAYLLSQISIAASVFCIWTLAKHLMSPARALMAALIFYTFFISFPTYCIEFNNDTLQLSMWPLTTLFFFLAVKNQSARYWILAGIFAGLSMMTKYYSVAVLIPMAALVLITQDGRRSLRCRCRASGSGRRGPVSLAVERLVSCGIVSAYFAKAAALWPAPCTTESLGSRRAPKKARGA